MNGAEHARTDLEAGDVRRARERLKSLVVTYPEDLELRRLLAEAYRRDGQPAEAGRWGYLVAGHASDHERRCFERHNAFASYGPRATGARLRKLLRCDDLAAIADPVGRALLRDLPRKRPVGRRDGPVEAVGRRLAIWRARSRWR
ncbi:hypothetical protein GCM10023221_30860 [Luteimicrobium xylanilyticum]|uniref:Tetratricopeptide repeat protein n=1 Tax=Luteimicrobium xylanilyticum TaxID=1133546 RepID=A0A5P9Q882_9MICO|nr:DUF6584 family protein [Luteimicrobium xylanilyticum]QFU96625.1 hypothetical protein KDY119_00109 [Luteimicrobium xylanilyticum]